MLIAKDRQITINEHELRILTIWASNWIEGRGTAEEQAQSGKALAGILGRLRKQLPGVPLTLAGEFQAVADHFGTDVEVRGGGETKTYRGKKPA